MKKIIPALVAILLILMIGVITVGGFLYEKYSYSKERANLTEYFKVGDDRLAIVLQDEMIEEQAVVRADRCYLDIDTIKKYFN